MLKANTKCESSNPWEKNSSQCFVVVVVRKIYICILLVIQFQYKTTYVGLGRYIFGSNILYIDCVYIQESA